uniref:Uncharacterized protein n=1 Tax=viral metagenome TaxID=1070528 RepID=A0A6M3MDV1_9ZZZZ
MVAATMTGRCGVPTYVAAWYNAKPLFHDLLIGATEVFWAMMDIRCHAINIPPSFNTVACPFCVNRPAN